MPSLINQSVPKTLLNLAVPMLAGTFALNSYNITATWFVSRLGTNPLAAMSCTLPVVMLLGFSLMALGTGTMTVVAHALGGKKYDKAARVTSHSILLMLLVSFVLALAGLFTLNPVFRALGATGEVLKLACDYMVIWYISMPVLCLENMFVDIITCTGNTKISSMLMVISVVINLTISPFLIFGWGPFPFMGIKGAALATGIAESFVLVISSRILYKKNHLINANVMSRRRIFISWRRILNMGLPAVYSSILTPVSTGIITKIISAYGAVALAAMGVIGRIEMFSFMIPMSVGMSLTPFVAQNYGALRLDRIRIAQKLTMSFALIYGLVICVFLFFFAENIAGLFSKDPELIAIMVMGMRIVCFAAGFLETFRYCTFFMNGVQKPLFSALLSTIRIVFLLVPLAVLFSSFWGLKGVFYSRFVTDVLASSIGAALVFKVLKRLEKKEAHLPPDLLSRHPTLEQRSRDYPGLSHTN